ncbi:putative disease resistance protein At1g59780 [Carex rostrata]
MKILHDTDPYAILLLLLLLSLLPLLPPPPPPPPPPPLLLPPLPLPLLPLPLPPLPLPLPLSLPLPRRTVLSIVGTHYYVPLPLPLSLPLPRRTVLSIVGTGGLGKTTLVQEVYNSAKLEGQFDCRKWVTISQNYNLNDILREILYSVDPRVKYGNPLVTDRDLALKLTSSLRRKRYLIILDDVWDIDLWEQLEIALLDLDNASRVIITTRSLDVAIAADCNTKPYKLRYLNDDEGLYLLFRTVFQQDVQPENYPHDLLGVAKKLMKKCGGLPLALVVLGGILTRRDRTYTAWNTLDETIDWHDRDGKKCMKVLARSYEDLPSVLKSCFLYFGLFPEDYEISGEHVTRIWMAEGFIPKNRGGTMEERAEKFLQELAQRCLIEVTEKSWNNCCKYYSMHVLLRDLAICKAKEENFFTIFSKEEEDINQLVAINPHRAALQFCTLTEDGVYSENTRSLFCFGLGKNSSDDCGFSKLNFSGFRLLRVLTLEHVNMEEFAQIQWPKDLIHLRYLGLRCCYIPQEIINKISFYNLETIDFKGSALVSSNETTDLCNVVIPTLRHVYCNSFYLPLKWDQHTNLQTVKNVWIERESFVEFGCCINLRTLVICFLDNERALDVWQNLKDVLRSTKQLVSLGIKNVGGLLSFDGTEDLPCHEKIQKLHLQGKAWVRDKCVLSVEMFPTNLTKLTLAYSMLEEDPMPILEMLQSLKILNLGHYSYVGTHLICSTGGFSNLEKLKLVSLPNLCHWDIKEGAMPILIHLKIDDCEMLHKLPELQKVQTLQELLLPWASPQLRESMQGEDQHKFEHIPSLHTGQQQQVAGPVRKAQYTRREDQLTLSPFLAPASSLLLLQGKFSLITAHAAAEVIYTLGATKNSMNQ